MKHPLAGLMRAFTKIEDTRVFAGQTRPIGCLTFKAHPNPRQHATCVRCGRKRDAHE